MRSVIAVDPAVGLHHPLVALAGVARQHVAVDQRLGELGVQRVQEPALPGDVGRGVDEAVRAAEVGERRRAPRRGAPRPRRARRGRSAPRPRAPARRAAFTSALDSARIASAIACASSGVKARAVTSMIPAVGVVGDRRPCAATARCSASIVGSSPRVKTGSPSSPAAAGAVPDRPEVELGVDRGDDLLAADVLVEDGGVRGGAAADLGQRAEQPGGRRGDLLGADREGDLGVVLVGGAGEEVGGRRGEGQQHQQQEAGERPPVPRPGAGRQRAGAATAALGAAAAAPAAPAALGRRSPAASAVRRPAAPASGAAGAAGRPGAPGRRAGPARRLAGDGAELAARRCGRSSGGGVIGPLIGPRGARSAVRPPTAGLVIAAPPGLPLAPDESKPRGPRPRTATGARCRPRRSRRPPRRSRRRSGPAGRGSSGCG